MMFPYLTLNDETEITHSEMKPDGRVKVYIETPPGPTGTVFYQIFSYQMLREDIILIAIEFFKPY